MTEWQNVSAGPRQVKDLNRAASALQWEGKNHDEITGVVGGQERRSTYAGMFEPVRPEVTALDEAIRAKYDHQITSGNVRAIIADYEAAMPEARKSRPVTDNRRTPEEDARLMAVRAEQEADSKARTDAANAVLTAVLAKAPAGAKALIVAEYHEDASDPMTDLFASRTVRTVAIGFRFTAREDFRALRAAAAQFPETAHIAADPDAEHRENYSMGAGNYLSDHGSMRSGTGWVVRSAGMSPNYGVLGWTQLTEDAIPAAPAVPATSAGTGGVTVSPSSTGREGVVEIRFASRPGDGTLSDLKAHGFRWARGNRCWYGSDTAYAETLVSA